jgi:7-cyano-7-deazaguanine synthase
MSKRTKAVILLSAGLDSCVALAEAVKQYEVVLALTFDYGQRAAKREIVAARKIAKFYDLPHQVIKLNWFKKIINTALVNKHKPLPELKNIAAGNFSTAQAVWVPNRNGLFLNIAAAFAEALQAGTVITGFNKEEAQTFPDNSLEFCQSADKFFYFSTLNKVKIKNYFYKKEKAKIIKTALKNNAPLEYLWSCYEGGRRFCGKCESCLRLKNALLKNGLLEIYTKKYHNYRGLK